MEDEIESNSLEPSFDEEIRDEKERKLVDLIIKMIVTLTLTEFYEKGD